MRKVKFVGVFAYNKERPYTAAERELLREVDWLELDPPQMKQYLKMKSRNKHESISISPGFLKTPFTKK